MNLDPHRWETSIAALPGAAIYGLFHFAVLLRTGQPVTVRDVVGVVVNLIAAVMAGMILSYVLGTGAIALIPWPTLRDPAVVGFLFGAFGWELLPIGYKAAQNWGNRKADKAGQE